MTTGTPGGSPERPALFFSGPDEFRAWLEEHHETETELWMGLRKKHVPDRGLTWEQAVPEALCFGWIDSVAQRIDEDSTRQRWTPRKATSTWSTVNLALVERLEKEGRMRPAGRAAYERRRPERQGIYTYEQDGTIALPPHMQARLDSDAVARAFWERATRSYRRLATAWVLDAKREETREKRLGQLIEDSAACRLVPPQRYGAEPAWVVKARAELRP